jgi:hypothetical protein
MFYPCGWPENEGLPVRAPVSLELERNSRVLNDTERVETATVLNAGIDRTV